MERFQYDFDAIVRDIRSREASTPTPLLEPPALPPSKTAVQRARFARRSPGPESVRQRSIETSPASESLLR